MFDINIRSKGSKRNTMTDKDLDRWFRENYHKLPTYLKSGVSGLEERNDTHGTNLRANIEQWR